MDNRILLNKNIFLEEHNSQHTELIFNILNQEIGENVGWELKKTIEELGKFLKREDLKLWSIFLNNKLVGCIFLDLTIKENNVWTRKTANLGYFVDKNYRKKGCISLSVPWVVKYAFKTLGIKRLIAGCLENNMVSKNIIEKNGFKLVGVERNYAKPKSSKKYLNHYLYDLIA